MKTIAIIPAGGAGKRLKAHVAKQYLFLEHIPVLVHALKVFQKYKVIDNIILAVPPDDLVSIRRELIDKYCLTKVTTIVAGGNERQDSVRNSLLAIHGKCDIVVIHDGVRPFVTQDLIKRVVEAAKTDGAATAGVKAKDTIKETKKYNRVAATVPRRNLWLTQTPQAFKFALLKEAYQSAYDEKFYGTDDASLVERIGKKVKMIEGSYENIKITTSEDLIIAEALMKKKTGSGAPQAGAGGSFPKRDIPRLAESIQPPAGAGGFLQRGKINSRSGFGYDSHRFAAGRELILGGVGIPFDKGLKGHSDADALSHAICDALLGAAGCGDIGRHFPDKDPKYKDISSIILLERVKKIIKAKGFSINNVDATVVMEMPKLAPYAAQMVSHIALALDIAETSVNIKAKTNEGMGFTGRNEGVAAFATATVTERENNGSKAPS